MRALGKVIPSAIAIATVILGAPIPAVAAPGADPLRNGQWHLAYLNVAEAHAYSQGDGIIVGVIDTGVDGSHLDLAGSVLPGHDILDDAGNGQKDIDGHGTAMAGLIVAHGRTLGIAPKAKILPVRATGAFGSSDAAIRWAVSNGARVSVAFVR